MASTSFRLKTEIEQLLQKSIAKIQIKSTDLELVHLRLLLFKCIF